MLNLSLPRMPLAAFSLLALACATSQPALADNLGNPPKALLERAGESTTASAEDATKALSADNKCPYTGSVCYDLNIRYVTGKIRNPSFAETDPRAFDYVKLRSYAGDTQSASTEEDWVKEEEFVAPQVELEPGNTFRLTLNNQLAKADEMELPWGDCEASAQSHNDPHCANFNLTNMHAHGLWISPTGNSDNVLLRIDPQTSFTYEYNIPEDHPAGTFWYHSHHHGSTAPQVSSGMAGSLIIRGKREPRLLSADDEPPRWKAGDIDVLLPREHKWFKKWLGAPTFPERVMLFQQIAYACRWTTEEIDALADDGDPLGQFAQKERLYSGKIKTRWTRNTEGETVEGEWFCDSANPATDLDEQETHKLGETHVGRVGTVEPGLANRDGVFDLLGPGSWIPSKRHTTINGTINKALLGATVGTVERWRLIHGGVRETVRLQIRKASSDNAVEALLAGGLAKNAAKAAEVCSGQPLEVVGLATDGLTRPALDASTDTWLQPGYRADILVRFPEPGTYCLYNADVEQDDNVDRLEKDPAILGTIQVKGAAPNNEEGIGNADLIRGTLIKSARHTLTDKRARDNIINDLRDGGKLSAFVWHKTIEDTEIDKQQTLAFQLDVRADLPPLFAVGELKPASAASAGNPFNIHLPPEAGEGERQPRAYEAEDYRVLSLDSAEQWLMTSFSNAGPIGHPYHIHVNPFQIINVWKYQADDSHPTIEEANPSTWVDMSSVAGGNNQYAGFKETWKDTVFVQPGHLVQIRSRYQRYIGDFVLHCHILDHEDQGMMQNVRIVLPNEEGKSNQHAH